jgi:hypothetical protein
MISLFGTYPMTLREIGFGGVFLLKGEGPLVYEIKLKMARILPGI